MFLQRHSSGVGRFSVLLGLVAALLAVACADAATAPGRYVLVPAFPKLRFSQPLDLRPLPGAGRRLLLAEREGRLRIFDNRAGAAIAPVFLDISSAVSTRGEGGLLGVALHPQFARNRQLFVYYTPTGPRRVRISRFTASADGGHADVKSEKVVLEVAYPERFGNHNAGSIAFGPVDGMLYLGMGDGGGGGDPFGNGQNLSVLLGKILRIDVSHAAGGRNYAIPRDNPYTGNDHGLREEIFAYGMRNPWRISFDVPVKGSQLLWVADVGQNRTEEIDVVEAGRNYGWNTAEGSHCYPPTRGCKRDGLTPPVAEYGHDLGRSITGGYVYRGRRLPELKGRYLFADFISGRVWALPLKHGAQTLSQLEEIARYPQTGIASFGIDVSGEVYLLDLAQGAIYTLQRARSSLW